MGKIETFMERLAEHVIKKRNIYTAIAIIVTIFFGWQCRKLSVKTVFADLLPQQHPYIKLHNEIRNKFGGANQVLIMVGVKTTGKYKDVFNTETLKKVKSITNDLLLFNAVDRFKILSLASAKVKDFKSTPQGYVSLSVMNPEVPTTEEDIKKLRLTVYGSPICYPGLVSLDSAKTLIQVDFFEEQMDYTITYKELTELRKKYEDDNHFVAIAGNPMHIGYIESYVPGAIRVFGYTIIAFLALFYVFFRSKRGMIMPVFAALLSAVWGLGFLAMMNFNLDPLVLVFPFLIGALTACHAVQVVKRYKEEVYHLGDTKAACKKIISSLFVPGVGGAITDSTGILIICITPIPIIQKICLVCGFWVFGTIFIAMFLLPILLSYFPLPPSRENYAGFAQEGNSLLDKMLYHMGRFICGKGKYGILIAALVITSWAYVQQLKLPVGNVVPGSEILWPFHRYNVDAFRLIFNMPLLNPMYIVCEADKPYAQSNPTLIREIIKFARYMSRTPNQRVVFVGSLNGPIPNFNRAIRDTDPKWIFPPSVDDQLQMLWQVVYSTGSPGDWDKYISADSKAANIVLFLRDKTADSLREVIDRVNKFVKEESLAGKPIQAKINDKDTTFTFDYRLAGGTSGVQAAINETLVKYNDMTTWIAYVIVFFVVAASYQSFMAALYISLPLLTSTFLTQAFMTLNNPPIPLTTATLPVASVGIGLGEDYAMYIVSRIIEEYRDNKRDLNDAIAVALGTSGKAVVYIGITFICGLGFWALSQLMFQALMGLFLAIILVINILGALFVVPSFISLFKPKFITSKRQN
jgi:hypothetical protein